MTCMKFKLFSQCHNAPVIIYFMLLNLVFIKMKESQKVEEKYGTLNVYINYTHFI